MNTKSLKILIVDDEPLLREVLGLHLNGLGHQVVFEASNGVEAFDIFRFNSGMIDLVITDRDMIGGNGVKLIEDIKGLSPTTPVILCSGRDT